MQVTGGAGLPPNCTAGRCTHRQDHGKANLGPSAGAYRAYSTAEQDTVLGLRHPPLVSGSAVIGGSGVPLLKAAMQMWGT